MTQKDLERRFEEIDQWLILAVESEQPNGPAPFNNETELRMNTVLRLVREGMGLPPQADLG